MTTKIKKFADGTKVTVHNTRAHIERELEKYQIRDYGVAIAEGRCMVTFRFKAEKIDRTVRLWFLQPAKTYQDSEANIDREIRRLWRCLFLTLKAKLESVHSGIETFDEAFLAHIVTPGGTVGDQVIPKMQAMIEGEDIKLLPGA